MLSNEYKNILETSSPVARIGSKSGNLVMRLEISREFLYAPLAGSLAWFEAASTDWETGSEKKFIIAGQISSPEIRNLQYEDLVVKQYVRDRDDAYESDNKDDFVSALFTVVGAWVFDEREGGFVKDFYPAVPRIGTPLYRISEKTMREFMKWETSKFKSNPAPVYGWLGYSWGSSSTPFPVHARHFGDWKQGGNGESSMGCVFGQSGSGKSVVAASLLTLYAKNDPLGILILDPVGQFSSNDFGNSSGFDFDFHKMWMTATAKRKVPFTPEKHVLTLRDVVFEGEELFLNTLVERGFLDSIGMKSDEKKKYVVEDLQKKMNVWKNNRIKVTQIGWDETNLEINKLSTEKPLEGGYVSKGSLTAEILDSVVKSYAASNMDYQRDTYNAHFNNNYESIKDNWNSTVEFFVKKRASQRTLSTVLSEIGKEGAKYIINLDTSALDFNSKTSADNKKEISESFKLYLVRWILRQLKSLIHKDDKKNDPLSESKLMNCLVVLDEAGRFVPDNTRMNNDGSARTANIAELCSDVSRYVKELRKFGIGMLFINQGIRELHRDIYSQAHYRIYGFGLKDGENGMAFLKREGEEAFSLYSGMPDPKASGKFPFLVSGSILGIGNTGAGMLMKGFVSGTEFLKANNMNVSSESLEKHDEENPTTENTHKNEYEENSDFNSSASVSAFIPSSDEFEVSDFDVDSIDVSDTDNPF